MVRRLRVEAGVDDQVVDWARIDVVGEHHVASTVELSHLHFFASYVITHYLSRTHIIYHWLHCSELRY